MDRRRTDADPDRDTRSYLNFTHISLFFTAVPVYIIYICFPYATKQVIITLNLIITSKVSYADHSRCSYQDGTVISIAKTVVGNLLFLGKASSQFFCAN